ncbi:MAG: hypothetical protein ABWJ42_01865 [Sulfolobales archaeon]
MLRALKLYFKGLLIPRVTAPMLLGVILAEIGLYHLYTALDSASRVMYLSSLIPVLVTSFFNPLFITAAVTHIARTQDLTVFEFSLVGSRRSVSIARIIACFTYVSIYLASQIAVVYLYASQVSLESDLMLYISLAQTLYFYAAISVFTSVSMSRSISISVSSIASFALPLSTMILLQNSINSGRALDLATSLILYILNSFAVYTNKILYGSLIELNVYLAVIVHLLLLILILTTYIVLFERIDIKI